MPPFPLWFLQVVSCNPKRSSLHLVVCPRPRGSDPLSLPRHLEAPHPQTTGLVPVLLSVCAGELPIAEL